MPTVVIVDDQATDRRILARLTGNLAGDIAVEAFGRPAEALGWLAENQPDLILVDYRMPDMDGIAFIESLGRIEGLTPVPVVVITVVEDSDLRYQALAAGATDFLTKPLDLQECEARCRNLLTLRRQQLTIARHAEGLAEARRRIGRALRTLSLGNELLLGNRLEPELLHGMCRIVAQQAGYPLVRVGLWNHRDRLYEVACASSGAVEVDGSLSSEEFASIGESVRGAGEVRLFNDLSGPDAAGGWLDAVSTAGFGSAAILPIRVEGLVDGVLAVFSVEPAAFDQDEIELLVRAADSLGYGLADRRARRARDQAERDCRYLTHFDRLTGLPNRNRLLERMRQLVEDDDPDRAAAVLVINLDRFKLVNDTTGHEAGDQLLVQVVQRLHAILGGRDLLARQSGDEFVLLIRAERDAQGPGGDDWLDQQAARMAERVIESMRRPFEVAGYEYYIGASVGISHLDAAHDDVQSVLRQGDTAMRQAKEGGGNTYSYYSGELTERHTRRLSLEGSLRRAIDQGDFVLHYQPIVALESGAIHGLEALIRWQQEDGSLLPPDQFIPLAEETGLMDQLGLWVARAACEQARAWEAAGLMPRISVNLSVHQLLHRRLAQDLVALSAASGVGPDRFEFEITESAIMADPSHTERTVQALHDKGAGIALDDFGTGYSSFSRLRHLPITTLKIDKSFVLGLPSDPAAHAIVRSILQLAENLDMRAVAEGIETAEHEAVLQEMGCRYGQGFHFAYPAPAEELRPLLGPDTAEAALAGAGPSRQRQR